MIQYTLLIRSHKSPMILFWAPFLGEKRVAGGENTTFSPRFDITTGGDTRGYSTNVVDGLPRHICVFPGKCLLESDSNKSGLEHLQKIGEKWFQYVEEHVVQQRVAEQQKERYEGDKPTRFCQKRFFNIEMYGSIRATMNI